MNELFDAEGLSSRDTFTEFMQKKPELNGAWNSAHAAFLDAAAAVTDSGRFTELTTNYTKALEAMNQVARKNNRGVFVPKPGEGKAATDAIQAFYTARSTLRTFMDSADAEGEQASEALKTLRTAYAKAKEAEKPVLGFMNSMVGKLSLEGFGNTIKHNLKFWDKDVANGRQSVVFGRVAATGIGAGIMVDAALRAKTADGDDRSVLVRIGEGAIGAVVAGGGALLGAAR